MYKLIDPDHECFVQAVADGWAEGRESRLDMAESQLDENIARGNETSIFSCLRRWAKAEAIPSAKKSPPLMVGRSSTRWRLCTLNLASKTTRPLKLTISLELPWILRRLLVFSKS